MKKIDWSKYIGYILFVATVIGWIFTAGLSYGRLERVEQTQIEINKKLDEQQKLLMKQQEINGKIIFFIETQLNSNQDE